MESISGTMKSGCPPPWLVSYTAVRTDGYVVLASLLLQSPSWEIMEILKNLHWQGALPAKMEHAFTALRQACMSYRSAAVYEEYQRLFVGLGCGEIVPYASWYKEKKIQSAALAALRADLMKLGVVRQTDCHESEDHAGTLCETMALISREQSGILYDEQAVFFHRHIVAWMTNFFQDIQKAGSAGFYRSVGFFGRIFLETESEFLQCAIKNKKLTGEGERQNENNLFERPADIH